MLDLTPFPRIQQNKCHQVEISEEFIIVDNSAGRSEIHTDNLNSPPHPHFKVLNPNTKDINFLAIDHCVLDDSDGKKCDCAVYDENEFCFIEIKTAGSNKRKSEKIEEAIEKLLITIALFKQKLNFGNLQIQACHCVGLRNIHPLAQSTQQAFKKELADLEAFLLEGNQKIF